MSKLLFALPGLFLPGLFMADATSVRKEREVFASPDKELIRRYCARCHGRRKQEGKLDLSDSSYAPE
ncbi:MAG: hypothetical protein ACYTG5_01165 [Planctomycetota bacterium]